jgi:O-acetyl-ADP-ribose deacetylase (regulator of RNase III)
VLATLLDPERERLSARDGFERAIAATFAAGGDVDTIGAIVAAVLGASHGAAAIPEGWLAPLRERRYLVTLADRLAAPREGEPPRAGVLCEVEGELATREVDAVVNAWNRNVIPAWLLVPRGVSRAIRRHGGRAALRAISRRSPMPLGSAWETDAGDLPARFVIHVAGIDLLWRASERSVSLAARNALLLARCLGATSVALPLIGAGSGGLPAGRARALLLAEMEEQRACFDRLELVRWRRGQRTPIPPRPTRASSTSVTMLV